MGGDWEKRGPPRERGGCKTPPPADTPVSRPGEPAPACTFCHLPATEAVAKLARLLGDGKEVGACDGCFRRMGDETIRMLRMAKTRGLS